MLKVILLLVLPIIVFFLLILNHGAKNRKKSLLPPGPPGIPIVGNLHQLDYSTLHVHLWKLSQKYGPLMFMRLGCVQTVIVSSAKMAREVVKTHDLIFASRPSFLPFKKFTHHGKDLAFAPYSDYWREMRKACVIHLFNAKRVQSFRSIREDEVSRMIEKISNSALAGKTVNLNEMLIALISTIVCRIAFGKRYDDEGYERSRFHSMLTEAQVLGTSFCFTDYLPWLGWMDKLRGLSQRLDKAVKEFDVFYQEIVDEHLNSNKKMKSEQEDFVDVLLKLKDEHLFSIDLTFDHIKGVLNDVFIAGTDTSASNIIWAMTLLIKSPGKMKKAQEEIRNVVGKKGFVDEDDLPKFSYLKAVIKETMRLYPPVPLLLPHVSLDKCVIDQYEIPANTVTYINAWAIGRDWENPNEFSPERFVGSNLDFRGQDFELIPFGAGRRSCPGIYMGIAMVELALANLLNSFDWELPLGTKEEDIDTEFAPGVIAYKKNPLCLIPKIVLV